MKHISFDQSTVLNEFARIADEKGFVKAAAGPDPVGALIEKAKAAAPRGGTMKVFWDGFIKDLEAYRGADPAEAKPLLLSRHGKNPEFAALINTLPAGSSAEGPAGAPQGPSAQQSIEAAIGQLSEAARGAGAGGVPLTEIAKQLKGWKVPADADPAEILSLLKTEYKWNPQAVNIFDAAFGTKKKSSLQHDGMKTAEEKKYDVTGEKGEDLIDAAHPGGGTKTELTHSKTDENLVETVVEQQEKDVDVAKSVPKGTYAALVGLYNKLHKMGHGEHLKSLAKNIRLVATAEDALGHTLVTLADELDRLGNKEAADKVDGIISKALDPAKFPNTQQTLKNMGLPGVAGPGMMSKMVSKVGPMAARVAPAATALLPWLGPVAGVAATGLAAWFIGKDLLYMSGGLDNLIDRLEDLDPNERAAGAVSQWISTLQQLKGKLVIPQMSTDAETQKKLMAQRAKDAAQVATTLETLQKQWHTDIKPNLTDWGMDANQAEQVLANTVAKFRQMANNVAAKLPKAEQAAEKQKAVEEKVSEEGAKGKGKATKDKTKGGWLADWATNPGKQRAIVQRYNRAVEGVPGEEKLTEDKAGAGAALKRLRQYGRGFWKKFEADMAKKKSGKAEKGESKPATEADKERLAAFQKERSGLAKNLAQTAARNIIDWTGVEKTKLSINARRMLNTILYNTARKVVQEVMPYQYGAGGTVAERMEADPALRKDMMEEIKSRLQAYMTERKLQQLYGIK